MVNPSHRSVRRTLLAATLALAALAGPTADAYASSPDCTRVASTSGSDTASGSETSPYGTAQKLADSLGAGETGCLRGGLYTAGSAEYVLRASRGGSKGAPVTIRSYPGERAKLLGIVSVMAASPYMTLSDLDFEGTGQMNSIKIYAADVTVERSDITNAWRGLSCLMLGSNSGYGQALRTVVRGNTFHACGNPANGNKDHAIYAANVADGEIVDNLIYDSAAYAIQLYPNAQRTRFAHNVIDGGSPSVRGGLLFGSDEAYASNGNVVEQNVIAYAETDNITTSWGGQVGSGNTARSNCVSAAKQSNIGTDGVALSANVTADPGFANRQARDYRLSAGSPCLATVGYDTAAKLAGLDQPAPTPTPELAPAPAPTNSPQPPRERKPRKSTTTQLVSFSVYTIRDRSARSGRGLRVRGSVPTRIRGVRRVLIQVSTRRGWRTLRIARVALNGRFSPRLRVSRRYARTVRLSALAPRVARSAVRRVRVRA